MEMMDVGKTEDYGMVDAPVASKKGKKKKYYPSLRIEKPISKNIEVGDSVKLVARAVVTAIRKDKYGNSVEFEVRKLGVTPDNLNKVGNMLASKHLGGK